MHSASNSNDKFPIRQRPGRRDWIDPTRYSVIQRFFLTRLEAFVAARRRPDVGLDRAQSRLIDHAIYSTYRDCIELGLADEARTVLHDAEGMPHRSPSA